MITDYVRARAIEIADAARHALTRDKAIDAAARLLDAGFVPRPITEQYKEATGAIEEQLVAEVRAAAEPIAPMPEDPDFHFEAGRWLGLWKAFDVEGTPKAIPRITERERANVRASLEALLIGAYERGMQGAPAIGDAHEAAEKLVAKWQAERVTSSTAISPSARDGLVKAIAAKLWGLAPVTLASLVCAQCAGPLPRDGGYVRDKNPGKRYCSQVCVLGAKAAAPPANMRAAARALWDSFPVAPIDDESSATWIDEAERALKEAYDRGRFDLDGARDADTKRLVTLLKAHGLWGVASQKGPDAAIDAHLTKMRGTPGGDGAVIALTDLRLDVLAERAGGNPIGAPCTREEERSMAIEILRRRRTQREKGEGRAIVMDAEAVAKMLEYFIKVIDHERESIDPRDDSALSGAHYLNEAIRNAKKMILNLRAPL